MGASLRIRKRRKTFCKFNVSRFVDTTRSSPELGSSPCRGLVDSLLQMQALPEDAVLAGWDVGTFKFSCHDHWQFGFLPHLLGTE